MTRFAFTVHRVLAVGLALIVFASMADYYLGLGFFGPYAGVVGIVTLGLGVIYMGFFAPTREEMRKQREARKSRDAAGPP